MTTNTLPNPNLPEAGFLRLHQILCFIPIGKSTWWKWVADGKAPAPIKLAPKTTVWRVRDIREFINAIDKVEGA